MMKAPARSTKSPARMPQRRRHRARADEGRRIGAANRSSISFENPNWGDHREAIDCTAESVIESAATPGGASPCVLGASHLRQQ